MEEMRNAQNTVVWNSGRTHHSEDAGAHMKTILFKLYSNKLRRSGFDLTGAR
jgi:hypothetical protein